MKHYERNAEEEFSCFSSESVGMAVSVKGKLLGIPVQAEIVRLADGNVLSCSISLTEEMLLNMMYHLSPDWKEAFCGNPLYPLVEGLCSKGAILLDSKGSLTLAVQSTEIAVGMIREGNGLLFLLALQRQEREDVFSSPFGNITIRQDDSFGEFLRNLRVTVGALDLRLLFRNGSGVSFDKSIARLAVLERAVFKKSLFENVTIFERTEFRDVTVLVSASADLSKSSLGFFRILKDIMPENNRIVLSAGFGKQLAVFLRMEQTTQNNNVIVATDCTVLNIRFLECTFLLGANPVLSLHGSLSFFIQDAEYLFNISCKAKSDFFALGAEYQSREKPISFGDFFRLYQLGLTIGVEKGGFLIGGWGIAQLGPFDLYAMLFLRCTGSVVSLQAMGIALNSMSISMLLNLVLSTPIAGMEEYDFLKLDPFPVKADKMDINVLADLSSEQFPKIAQAFSEVCQGECGGHMVSPVEGDAIMVRTVQGGGWMLTDEKNIRHYFIDRTGEISLSPQFYLCTEDSLPAGSYTLYRGMFVCASLVLFDVQINFFASIDDKNGAEALVTIAPIDKGWFRISQVARKDMRIRAAQSLCTSALNAECNVAEQYIYNQEGPGFYLRICNNDLQLCINASIEILELIKLDVLMAYESGKFNIYTEFNFLTLRARLILSADYGSINQGQFYFSVLLDLTFFQDIANKVIQTVQKFVAIVQSKISEAQGKLSYAQEQVLKLKGQIAVVDGKIANYSEELRRLRWWQFYKAPYLLLVLGGLEMEKAGIYVALGAAYASLEIARQVLEMVKVTTGTVGYLIQKLAEAISSIFYLKNISLVLDAKLASGLQAKLSTCFTLFGKDYTTEVSVSMQGKEEEIKARLHSGASEQISAKTENELNNMEQQNERENVAEEGKTEQNLEEVRKKSIAAIGQELGLFLKESEFPYNDCAGYRQCLRDGFDFVGKSAVTYGRMEALYQHDYGYADPLEERHAGQMSRNLSITKVQWQGVFTAVERIDCEELINEVKKQAALQNVSHLYTQNAVANLEQQWDELKKLQTMIRDSSGQIADLDRHFNYKRVQVRESTRDYLKLLGNIQGLTEQAPDMYYKDIFRTFAVEENMFVRSLPDVDGEQGFTHDDCETFFINPANEPVIDRLFTQVCEKTPGGALKDWIEMAEQDVKRKEEYQNYRIRI